MIHPEKGKVHDPKSGWGPSCVPLLGLLLNLPHIWSEFSGVGLCKVELDYASYLPTPPLSRLEYYKETKRQSPNFGAILRALCNITPNMLQTCLWMVPASPFVMGCLPIVQ